MKRFLLLSLLFFYGISYGQSWQSVGGGTNNSSHGLLTYNGKLIDLGSFNNPCNRVAEWDGTSWSCLGGGVGIVARAGVVWDGKLVVVGDFWNVQQPCVGCNGVAVWDGFSWSPLGNGVNNDVLSITVWNNQVVIAGDFTQADGVPVSRIVKWNGTVWESVGPIGSFSNDIRSMTEFQGELWVGGDFNNVGGVSSNDGLVKYDPSTAGWIGGNSGVDLIGGVNESVRVLYVNPNDGNLYMGGEFPELWDGDALAEDFNMSGIAMYDGSNWTPLGTGLNEYCRAMHEYNGDIIAGGYFTTAGGVSVNKIAKWNGTTWSPMGLGFDAIGIDEYVKSAAVWNGIFFAGGAYTQAEGNPMNFISQWYEPATSVPVAWMTASSTALCGSGCIDFLDNSTNNPTSWNWSFPGSNTPTSTVQHPGTVCYATSGTYVATLQACNGIGCTTQNVNIEISSGATVSVNDESICGGGSVTLSANPSVSGGTYTWWPTMEVTENIIVNPAVTTNYTVTYSYLGCTSNAVSTVTVGGGPTVAVNTASPSICEGQSTTLTAVPSTTGGTYLWLPGGETTESITVSPLTSTDYTCEYTLNGCASTPVISSVTVTSIPTVLVTDASFCGSGSATLSAIPSVGGGTYLWSPGGQTTPTITESPGATTSYSVVYTLNGCVSASEMGTITVGTTPTLAVADETICEGEAVILTPTPSAGGGLYLWQPTLETTSSIFVSPITTAFYDVVYTLNGCPSNTETIEVNVNPTPTVNTNDPTICEGQSIVLNATPSVSGGTYLWNPGGQTTSSINISPATSTDYTVVYTLNGCESLPEISSVTVNTTPTVLVADESICGGGSATLTANPSVGGGTYLWSPGGQTTPTITESPGTTTTYSVVYTLNGCVSTSEIGTINVGVTPILTVVDETICEGETVTLTPTPSAGGGTYLWSPGGETTQTISVSPNTTSIYSIIYTLNGCPSASIDGMVTVTPTPTVQLDDLVLCTIATSGTLNATPSLPGGTYLWTPGGETTASISVPVTNGTYTVVYTLNGCPSVSEVATVTTTNGPMITLTEVNNEITADQGSATYQWLDCNNGNAFISGATGQTFIPAVNGSYAVEINLNGCIGTSACTDISTIGIDEINQFNLVIYPNPSTGLIYITNLNETNLNFEVLDLMGKVVMVGNLNSDYIIDIKSLANGTYTLQVDGRLKTRIVKQ